jgi:hypothetical protein
MRRITLRTFALLPLLIIMLSAAPARDRPDFTIHPASTEITLLPGEQATMTLYMESAASMTPARVELVASLVDWRMERDGTIRYVGPGTWGDSASAWTTYSPGAVTLRAGGIESLRATIRVPMRAEPGVYRAGILIEPRGIAAKTKFTELFRITVRVLPERSEVMDGN